MEPLEESIRGKFSLLCDKVWAMIILDKSSKAHATKSKKFCRKNELISRVKRTYRMGENIFKLHIQEAINIQNNKELNSITMT
jgi:hypothetical protein